MSANNAFSNSTQAKEQEKMLKNATTKNEQPPLNKFNSNAKKVPEKPPTETANKTHIGKVLHEKDVNMEKVLGKNLQTKSLAKQDLKSQIMTSTTTPQQIVDFAKKKQERDQEILEIQEMLNKMKSPQESTERSSSQESPLVNNEVPVTQEPVTSSKITTEKLDNETVEKETAFYGRCKTELQLVKTCLDSANFRVARRDTARSSSTLAATNKPRSKSQQPSIGKDNKTTKKLNYNPEEARRYMKMQRKHRKENLLKDPTIKTKIEKEEIKKRLEELKKNTRKLICKSVQKKDKFLDKNLTNREAEQKHSTNDVIQQHDTPTASRKAVSNKLDLKNEVSHRLETKNSSIDLPGPRLDTNQRSSHRSTQSLNNVLRPSTRAFSENHKRIGLLRKTDNVKDFSPNSHKNYNFNKENENLEMLTKQLMNPMGNKNNKDTNNLQNIKEKQKESAKTDKETLASIEEKLNGKKKSEVELTDRNLKTNRSGAKEEPKPNELPYWLRPSTTQIYPYNFIAAVRKKLESIVHPAAEEKKRNQETSTTGLEDGFKAKKRKSFDSLEEKQIKKIKNIQETTDFNKRLQETRNVEDNQLRQLKPLPHCMQIKENAIKKDKQCEENWDNKKAEKAKSIKNIKTQNKNDQSNTALQKSVQNLDGGETRNFNLPTNFKSLESLNSEINSNLSSISLQIPISNTLTEVSSLRTESRRTYTHSKNQPFTQTEDELASISSQAFSSPEKNLNHSQKDFEFVKPRPVSPLSLEKVDKLKIKRRETNSQQTRNENKEMDFTELLEDFNRSLSQVIQVNEQLKSSLDKSQQILSPASGKKSTESDNYYSSDFEKTSTAIISAKEHDKLKQSLQTSNENLQLRKRQLFEIAEKVKPLLTPQKSVTEKEEKRIQTTTINLTNTNATTSEDEVLENTSSSIESQSYEKRLNQIEKLKETLKQTILESKRKRNEKQHESKIMDSTENVTETRLKTKTSENSSEEETQYEENLISNCKISEKYEKQYKNNDKTKRTYEAENLIPKDSPKLENKHSQQIKQNIHDAGKLQDMTDYSSFQTNSASNNSQSSTKRNLSELKSTSKSSANDSGKISTSNSGTVADSTSHTRDIAGTKSLTKSLKSQEAALNSSIAEELQKTFESECHENENIPLKTKHNTNLNEQIDCGNFIKTHINRTRGDFQDTISDKSQFNETQFLQAIEAASQISSTDFAQSADDEITSSVASRNLKSVSNPPNLSARNVPSPFISSICSPSKINERVSIGSEIVRFIKQYDSERNERLADNNDSMSESSLNYSNVGLYEKLIQNETNKSQHLMALLKMREKALLDRTKGQIAWLEVQKARYKAKGFINQIAAIKKKQRGILVKMEKEREEIKRLLVTTTISKTALNNADGHKTTSQHNSPIKHKREKLPAVTPTLIKPKTSGQQLPVKANDAQNTAPILRATYDLESSRAVEDLLKKREEDLRKRRDHVERLMQWHQRLDEEEAEVLNLERQLLSYNNAPYLLESQQQQQTKLSTATNSTSKEKLTPAGRAISTSLCTPANNVFSTKKKCASRARKMEKRLKEIDKSLKELSHISASSTTSAIIGQTQNEKEDSNLSVANQEIDFVRTTGLKLNKLWKRLTSQQIEKFEPLRRYKLCKTDLERLYEEAKMAVLRDFAEDEERIAKELLEKSASNLSSATSPPANLVAALTTTCESKIIDVPMLNLNFSSGHSEAEEESANNSQHNTKQQGNYSPSVAEENFKAQVLLNSSVSSETISEQQMAVADKETTRLENNVQMFLTLSQRIQASSERHLPSSSGKHNRAALGDRKLQRSLSDTEISDVPSKYKAEKSATSQITLQARASHSNSSITGSFDSTAQHQRSKSSIVEMTTYIPSTQTATLSNNSDHTQTPTTHLIDNIRQQQITQTKSQKDLETVNHCSRTSVICSVGSIPLLKTSQETSSDIATITEDVENTNSLKGSDQQKSSYSGQVGTNSEATAKEISKKLNEITAAVSQLSQMNTLPSYESVAYTHLRNKSIEETNDEKNSSADASSSSYSFNFENITTDKHSSPGTSTSLNTHLIQNATLASKTYTKEMDPEHNDTTKESSATSSTPSKTFIKDDAKTSSQTFTQSMLENRILDTYEADFESDLSNVTHIEDITIPTFETTAETTVDNEDENNNDDNNESSSSTTQSTENMIEENISAKLSEKTFNTEELRNSLSPSDSKYSSQNSDRGPPPPLPPPPPPPSSSYSVAASSTNTTAGNHLMPDIINELELRRHQLILDNEHLKQYEHVTAVPYMYVREIPNKPPPPYVPPAHGSPMTTIFPSEDRIKDITFRRTHELYCELLKTEYCNDKGEKLPSVMEEQITNIYERIILDICREYLEYHDEILQDGDPINFHSQLAFFNPPNRLRCIQDAVYKEVRTCLAMDKTQPKRTQIYSVYGQRAKQDHIGKVIIQEMYDEDDRWCNFHREESEVLHLMVEEMINKNIVAIAKEVLLEEGGTIDEESNQVVDENQANHQTEDTSIFEESVQDESKIQQLTELETSSLLKETVNEEDQTYCVSETAQYTVSNHTTTTTSIETELPENVTVKHSNLTSSPNAAQTCT